MSDLNCRRKSTCDEEFATQRKAPLASPRVSGCDPSLADHHADRTFHKTHKKDNHVAVAF